MFNKKLPPIVYFLFTILIIASFFRLYNITQTPPGLYPDEAMNGTNAQEALSTTPPAGGFKVFYPENNGREGLFINIQALSVMTFGNQPWALRGVSAIFGIFTVLGIYFLTKKLFENYKFSDSHDSKLIALLSAFLIATNFWHINFSRIGFRAIMAPFFLTWGIYFLLKLLNSLENNLKLNIRYYGLVIIGGLVYGLGFHSYIAYRATPAIIIFTAFLYWLKNKDLSIRKRILLVTSGYLLVAFITFAPLGYYFAKHPADFMGRTTQVSVFKSPTPLKDLSLNIIKTAGMFNFSGDQNWRHNYSGNPELFWPVGIMFLVGIFFAIKNIYTNLVNKILRKAQNDTYSSHPESSEGFPHFPFYVLLSWIFTAALPVVISNEGIPHALRSILMIPPVIILAGFGGILIYEKIIAFFPNHKNIFLYTFYIILFTIFSFAYASYFIKWAHNPNTDGAFAKNYVDMGNQLNSLPKEMPKYVIIEAGGGDVRGLPMPTQTIMFITDTFTPEKQKEKNIFYVLPNNISQIPQNAFTIELK